MTSDEKKKVKSSFIAGSLTSSAGVFLSKLVGLLYVSPLHSLATLNNMDYYSAAYNYYSVLLQICSAGLPYAVAAIIAKYASKDDWKTVMLVRRLSIGILSAFGFAMAVIFAAVSGPLSSSVLGPEATAADLQKQKITFIILSLALFLVPILYSYRSFYQGLKDLKSYADSQVIEQFVRVGFLLGMGWVCIYIFGLDRVWAVYMAALGTSIGALGALFYYLRYDRRHIGPIRRAARNQTTRPVDHKVLMKELFAFGVPYLITAIFGNSQVLVNTQFFVSTMTSMGMDYQLARNLYTIIQLNCDKLTSIPQVLGIGFSSGIVPYMTISLEQRNFKELRKNIRRALWRRSSGLCGSMHAMGSAAGALHDDHADLHINDADAASEKRKHLLSRRRLCSQVRDLLSIDACHRLYRSHHVFDSLLGCDHISLTCQDS